MPAVILLCWQTKQPRKKTSPIYGWLQGLVEKAMLSLSSDLARKEFDWPLPLTERFYHKQVLQILEKVWNFNVASVVIASNLRTNLVSHQRGGLSAR
jgi:hypothetical protein